jgi:hypothetical protein
MAFWILFGIDSLAALVALYFFAWGLSDGTVSSFNFGIWAMLLGGIGAILGGGAWLRAIGWRRMACLVLSILVVPAAAYAILLLAVVIFQPSFR